jgi:hypothetical protein
MEVGPEGFVGLEVIHQDLFSEVSGTTNASFVVLQVQNLG